MLDIDFKAPVDVTITFDESDDEEIKDNNVKEITTEEFSESANSKKTTNNNINKEMFAKSSAVSPRSMVATKKRKLESQPPVDPAPEHTAKHTVITTQGQTHIIVTPPTNPSLQVDETNKINKYLDNSLKTISEHLIVIMQAYQQFSLLERNRNGLDTEPWNNFIALKNYFFNLSYSAVVSILVPQENDILFVTRFLKDTLKLCKENNTLKTMNEQQIFPFYSEMLEWAKRKQKQLPEIRFVNIQNQISDSDKTFQKRNPLKGNINNKRKGIVNDNKRKTPAMAPINNTVTNIFPSHQKNSLPNYNNFREQTASCTHETLVQNHFQHAQYALSQVTPSGQNLPQKSQGQTWVPPSAQNLDQGTQYNLSQMRHMNQNPYFYVQQGLAQPLSRGNFSNTMTNFQNVPQTTLQPQFSPRNTNAGFVDQLYSTEDRNFLNQASVNSISHVPVPQASYQINNTQNRTDQYMQWLPIKQPPPYNMSWRNDQGQKSLSTEQQQIQATPRERTPIAQRQLQAESQPPEMTRSMSTDSGIVSPLPFINTTDATNSYHIDEGQPTPFITHVTSLNPKVSYNSEGKCSVCFKTTKLKCLCLEKYYCSYDCQESDWDSHSINCSTQKTPT